MKEIAFSWRAVGTMAQVAGSGEMIYLVIGASALLFFGLIIAIILRKFLSKSGTARTLDMSFLDQVGTSLTPEEMKKVRDAMLRQMVHEEKHKQGGGNSIQDLEMMLASGAIHEKTPGPEMPEQATEEAPPPMQGKTPDAKSRFSGLDAPKAPKAKPKPSPTDYGVPRQPEKKSVRSLSEILRKPEPLENEMPPPSEARPEMQQPAEASAPEEAGSGDDEGVSVDVKVLYEKGLISREQYEKIKGAMQDEKKGNS
ncbi:MAG: hypothetical protein ACLFUS_10885 [Candidatus Sumerlaeia bacterium]